MTQKTRFVPLDAVDALADAWASIDGKLMQYRRGAKARSSTAYGGHHAGYTCEAEELIRRLKARGYALRKLPRQP